MAVPQSGICPATGAFGIFLTLHVGGSEHLALRRTLAAVPELTASLGEPSLCRRL
ncbi:hypothetical protein MCP1_260037 [Candidatus Terasakiella magnetica]|nr:hypothetical protein MCP1_260037 [Candidatus Terasakiella magnetica]